MASATTASAAVAASATKPLPMPPKSNVQSTQARTAAATTIPFVTVSTAAAATSAAAAPSPTRPYAAAATVELQPRSSLDSYLAAAGLAPFGRRQPRRSGSIQIDASGAAAAANASSGARSPLHPRIPLLQQHRQARQKQQQQQQQQPQQQQSGIILLPLLDTEAERRTARDAEIAFALQNYELASAAPGGDGGRAASGPSPLLATGFAGVRGANGLAAWPDDAASILRDQQRQSESPTPASGPIVVQPLLAAKPLPAGFRTIRDLSAGDDDSGADGGGASAGSKLSTLLRGRLRSQQVRRERLAPLQMQQRQRSNGGQVLPELPWVKRHTTVEPPRPSSAPPPTTRRQPPQAASPDMAVDVATFPLAAAADVLVYPSAAVRRAPASPTPLPEFVVTPAQQTSAKAARATAAAGTAQATRLADQHRARVARLVAEAGRVPVAVTISSEQQQQQQHSPLPSPPAPPKGPRSPRVFAPPVEASVRGAASPPSPASSPSETPVALPASSALATPRSRVPAAMLTPSAAPVGRSAPPSPSL
ncbi:hypothetical protein HK405_009737, partial [Cladochytrium tenue]